MTLTKLKLSSAAALALLLATPSLATDVSMEFDSDNFDTPLVIDNPYLTYAVGASFTYKAETDDGCEWSVVTVSPDTKDISIPGQAMITVRVVEDFEYEDEDCGGPVPEELSEKTFDWFGQDDFDNVWYFGEDTFNCDGADDCTQGGGTWEAGEDGALPGIIMLGDPDSGERYRQEFAEEVAEDWGMVMNLNNHPVLRDEDAFEPGTWEDCLVTKEWNGLEPGSVEQKTYCQDVEPGNVGALVLIEEHSGKLVRFELVEDSAAAADSDAFTFRVPPKN